MKVESLANANVYVKNGYNSRAHYLRSLSDDFGVPLETVKQAASILGKSEDFDGLVSAVNEASYKYY